MITQILDNDLTKYFEKLADDRINPLEISGWYCIAQWIAQFSIHWNKPVHPADIGAFVRTDPLPTILSLCELDRFPIEEKSESLAHLVGVIQHYNLTGINARYFYRDYLCCCVADTSYFSWNSPVTNDGALCCSLIHLCMVYAGETLGTRRIFDLLSPQVYESHSQTMSWFHISQDEFEICWNAVHYCDVSSPFRAHPKILEAAKLYEKFHASKRFLLDRYALSSGIDPKILRSSGNPLAYIQRHSGRDVLEGGLPDEDERFLNAAYQISRELPTDVIHTLFYADRDDSRIECMIVRTDVAWIQWYLQDYLIVNPSPMFILEYSRVERAKQEVQPNSSQTTFAVLDDTLCILYSRQFPQYRFVRIDELTALSQQYDYVLIFARDYENRNELWKAYHLCKENGRIAALVPETAITQKDDMLVQELYANHIRVKLMMGVPENLRQSAPKKKVLLYGRRYEGFSMKMRLVNSAADETGNWLVPGKKSLLVSMDLLNRRMTLAQMRKVAQNQKEPVPRKQEHYYFSKEIIIEYIELEDDNESLIGVKASYRTIHRPKLYPQSTKGKRVVKDIEKGLRGTSMEMIFPKLENAVLSDVFSPKIVDDIKDYYRDDLGKLSIKTMWFCCREALNCTLSYDEDIAKEFFCGECQVLSNLESGICVANDVVRAMAELYGENEVPQKKWLQLNLIFQTAIEEGLIERNPLVPLMLVVKGRSKERLYMLNAALKKSHFTEEEESRMIEFLREPIQIPGKDGVTAPRYVVESKWLVGAFSLLAGIPIREICPLLWGDLSKIEDDLDEMQVQITKHLSDKGIVISNVNYKNKRYFRKLALDMILLGMLLERRQFLKDLYGYTDDTLEEMLIMLEDEPSRGRGKKKVKMVSRATALKVNRRLLEEARISEDVISLLDGDQKFDYNLNAYRNDLFAANFRHKAYNYCGFTEGELAYHLGNKGPDTYSNNYCDYGDDFNQYDLVRKLYRWTYIFDQENCEKKTHITAGILETQKEYTTGRYARGSASASATVTPSENAEGSVIVEVEARHGLEGSATSYERGE